MIEKTNIYQSTFTFSNGTTENVVTYYFIVLEDLPLGYVRVRGLGRLTVDANNNRTWEPSTDTSEYPYPLCAKPRYWKNAIAMIGNNRIEGGRILRTRHGGGDRCRTSWMSLAECHPPPEYMN